MLTLISPTELKRMNGILIFAKKVDKRWGKLKYGVKVETDYSEFYTLWFEDYTRRDELFKSLLKPFNIFKEDSFKKDAEEILET